MSISTKHYSLQVKQKETHVYIKMQMLSSIISTSQLPDTKDILTTLLPGIHSSKCYNDQKLPFAKEVQNTEIGHLFEHILLEYIFLIKKNQTERNIVIKGETSWNWITDPK